VQRRPQDGAVRHATAIHSREQVVARLAGQREEYAVKALHDYK
jgi:cytochrome c553